MSPAEEMQACEEALLHTDFSSKVAALEKMLTADFTEVSSSGVISTRQVVVNWLLGKDAAARWRFNTLSVTELTADLRLVLYHAQQIAPVPSTSKGALHSSLWCYNGALQCWQLRFHQATKIL